MSSSPSWRASSVTPSPTPSTPSARPSPRSTSSMPSSARAAPSTASVVRYLGFQSRRRSLLEACHGGCGSLEKVPVCSYNSKPRESIPTSTGLLPRLHVYNVADAGPRSWDSRGHTGDGYFSFHGIAGTHFFAVVSLALGWGN